MKVKQPFLADFQTSNQELLTNLYMSIAFVGVTGSGKSFTANTIMNSDRFDVGTGMRSQTKKVRGKVGRFRGQPDGFKCIVTDTPGLFDADGDDSKHIAKMVMNLKIIGWVNTFIICINSNDNRINDQLQQTLNLFKDMFSVEFFRNAIICFTNFAYDSRTQRQRDEGRKLSEEQMREGMKVKFIEKYEFDLQDDQFVFIDNEIGVVNQERCEPNEIIKFNEALQRISDFTARTVPFLCRSVREVMREDERVRMELEVLQAQHEQASLEYDQKVEEANQRRMEAERQAALAEEARIAAEKKAEQERLDKEEAERKA